jgi:stage III sporulation protein AD
MIKIAVVGIAAVLIAIQFKNGKSEYGVYISLAACIIIFGLGISRLEIIIETINKIQGYIKVNQGYFKILIKIIGITYIAEFASNLCKDAGHASISNQIELVGKLTILCISMPIIMALLETMNEFLT